MVKLKSPARILQFLNIREINTKLEGVRNPEIGEFQNVKKLKVYPKIYFARISQECYVEKFECWQFQNWGAGPFLPV